MNDAVTPPIYAQIAFDIASRISRGELKVNSKISGRSLMSCEYGVSPETIRRSLRLLADMDIVLVQPGSGAIILSKENADKYREKFNKGKSYRELKHELKDLIKQRDQMNDRILKMMDTIFNFNEKSKDIEAINHYELSVPKNSCIVQKTLTDTKFWQNTGATIVGIRRNDQMILSPGPYAIFEAEDTLSLIGDVESYKRVEEFINLSIEG